MNKEYSKALVVDTSHMAKSIITAYRAYAIIYKGNAVAIANHPETIGVVDKTKIIYKPSIIKVSSYIKTDFKETPPTRGNIFKRDGNTCVYCDTWFKDKDLSLDHVHPKSKGGKNTWGNLVTACKKCNQEKDNLTIEEWGREHPNPKRPHYLMLLAKTTFIPEEWKNYLLL